MATDYTSYITSQYDELPKFNALLTAFTEPLGEINDLALGLYLRFLVNTAIGDQLDIIGEWVGVSRLVKVPLNIFFSYNTATLGWNQGVWHGPNVPDTGIQYLDDKTYRLVIKTFIKANTWDGTLKQYQEIMQTAFPLNTFFAVDNFDMSITIHVTGPALSQLMTAVLQGVLSEIRAAGVRIDSYVLPP